MNLNGHTRKIILPLMICAALAMTSLGITYPVFARRLYELGFGVEALGMMAMAYALGQFLGAPLMGSLADRSGRRPLILLALATFAVANIGFLVAQSPGIFTLVYGLEGFFTAGLIPASMGVVADVVSEDRRAQWIGIVMAGFSSGFIFGPIIGGVLYDKSGFEPPFIVATVIAAIAFLIAFFMVSETHTKEARQEQLKKQEAGADSANEATPAQKASFWAALPRPLLTFGVLLFINFTIFFAWAFVNPQLQFYVFDKLGWTTTQFGLLLSSYSVTVVLGEAGLGRLSDKSGRKPVLIMGMLLFSSQFAGLVITTSFLLILSAYILSGLGESLIIPALNAFYLDITPEQHRARIMGINTSAGSLGSIIGPALVVIVASRISAQGVFLISGTFVILAMLLALIILKEPQKSS